MELLKQSRATAEGTEGELPPPGSRWGMGAQSVLPYLTRSLQAKPAPSISAEQRDRAPRSGLPAH